MPLRRVTGLPGDGGAHQVRDTLEQIRDMHAFLQDRRQRYGPNFAHGYFGFAAFAVGDPELVREILLDRGANSSRYSAAATPSGKDTRRVTRSV